MGGEVMKADWLLVSDLDDTLTGDDEGLAAFVDAVSDGPGLAVAINSSRPVASIEQTLAGFPRNWRPAAVIGAMGTQIHLDGEPLASWAQRFTDWDRERVDDVLRRMDFTPHAPELQTPYKVSYTVPVERQAEARRVVEATGLAAQIVISGQTNFDVIPRQAGKAAAIEHLADAFDVSVADRLIVTGDSGNDLAMFDLAPKGIVVANADDQLRQGVDPARVHFADQPRARGVLEGLAAWSALAPQV